MSNPETGYNGRYMKILFGGVVIAAVQKRELKFNRESIDVTNDDSDGFTTFLSEPGTKGVDVSLEGVTTIDNYNELLTKWEGSTYEDVTVQHPNGTITAARDGFLLGALSLGAEHKGAVTFKCDLKSSGPVTNTPAVS
jgi:predicted secreted protein